MCFVHRWLLVALFLLAPRFAAAQVCSGGPSDPNISGPSGSVTASGGSCVYVGPTGAVNGRVRTSGTYTVTNEGQVTNPGSHGILDNTNDTNVLNRGGIDARDAIVVTPGSGTFRDGKRYDVLMARGGRSGRFSATLSSGSPVLRFETLYPKGRVQLRVERLPYTSLSSLTPNQSRVATALDRAVAAGSSPEASELTSSLDFLPENEIANAMTSLDPEIFDAYPQLADQMAELRFDAIERRMRAALNGQPILGLQLGEPGAPDTPTRRPEPEEELPAVSSPEPIRPTLWAYGLGVSGDKRGSVDVTGYDFDGAGAMVGADLPLSERFRMGLAGSWQETDVAFDRPGTSGDILGRGLALYATLDDGGPGFADLMVQQLWNRYESKRQVAFGDVLRRATSDHDGRVFASAARWSSMEPSPRRTPWIPFSPPLPC